MGFEKATTAVLLQTQRNLLSGLSLVAKHLEEGTFEISLKEGSAPPSQAGCLTLALLLSVEDELESRILGFKRTVV